MLQGKQFRAFNIFFWTIVALQVAVVGLVIWLVVEAVSVARSADWSNGLSGVVNQIWCGPKGCK